MKAVDNYVFCDESAKYTPRLQAQLLRCGFKSKTPGYPHLRAAVATDTSVIVNRKILRFHRSKIPRVMGGYGGEQTGSLRWNCRAFWATFAEFSPFFLLQWAAQSSETAAFDGSGPWVCASD